MKYFIHASSFAAPFISNESFRYQDGETPREAMGEFVKNYSHPAKLYAARLYQTADDYHQNKPHLVEYLSNQARFIKDATGLIYQSSPGQFEINQETHVIDDPYGEGSANGLPST